MVSFIGFSQKSTCLLTFLRGVASSYHLSGSNIVVCCSGFWVTYNCGNGKFWI